MNVVEWVKVEGEIEGIEADFFLVSDITNEAGLRTKLYYFPSGNLLVKKLSNPAGQTWRYRVFLSDVKE